MCKPYWDQRFKDQGWFCYSHNFNNNVEFWLYLTKLVFLSFFSFEVKLCCWNLTIIRFDKVVKASLECWCWFFALLTLLLLLLTVFLTSRRDRLSLTFFEPRSRDFWYFKNPLCKKAYLHLEKNMFKSLFLSVFDEASISNVECKFLSCEQL